MRACADEHETSGEQLTITLWERDRVMRLKCPTVEDAAWLLAKLGLAEEAVRVVAGELGDVTEIPAAVRAPADRCRLPEPGSHRRRVYDLLVSRGRLTNQELEAALGPGRTGDLSELCHRGLARRVGRGITEVVR